MSRNNIFDAQQYGGTRWDDGLGHVRQILTGNWSLDYGGSNVYSFIASGGNRTVVLPTFKAGKYFIIGNIGSSNLLTINNSVGAALAILNPGEAAFFLSTASEWQVLAPGLSLATLTTGLATTIGKFSFDATIAGNALTITLKDRDGNALTTTSPAGFIFRNPSVLSAVPVVRIATAPVSLVVSPGSSLGFPAGLAARSWIVLIDDGGVLRLGISTRSSSSAIYPLNPGTLVDAVAEGGAGGADSAGTIYAGASCTQKAFVPIGYIDWPYGLVIPGTWDVAPAEKTLWLPGVPLPGQPIGNAVGVTAPGAVVGSSNFYMDSGLQATITPTKACNFIAAQWAGTLLVLQTNIHGQAALRRGGQTLSVRESWGATGSVATPVSGSVMDRPGSTALQVYNVGVRNSDNVTSVFFPYANADGTGELSLEEIQG